MKVVCLMSSSVGLLWVSTWTLNNTVNKATHLKLEPTLEREGCLLGIKCAIFVCVRESALFRKCALETPGCETRVLNCLL